MIKTRKIAYILAGLLIGLISCTSPNINEESGSIAEVGNHVLSRTQLEKVIPGNIITKEDSTAFARDYINKWIKQQLLVLEAEKNLSNDELNVSDELEDYRQELIIHKFKEKQFALRNNQQVSDTEIENYYQQHLNLFVVDYPIAQVNYIIFPSEVELPRNFRKQLVSKRENDRVACEDFIFKFAKKYDDFNNQWMYLQQFIDNGDLNVSDIEKFLKKNELIEFNKDGELHIIYVKAYKLPGEQAPIEFVKPRINSLILNRKKLDFLRLFKDSLYNAALKYDNFRVINQ